MTAPSAVRTRSGWDGPRLLLAVVWLVLLLSALVLHERSTSLSRLYDDVRSGQVDDVQVVGGLSAFGEQRGTGFAVLEAHWSVGHRRYVVEVTEVAGQPDSTVPGVRTDDDVAAVLQRLDPTLQVQRQAYRSGWSATLYGTRLPGYVVPVLVAAGLATLLVLMNAPEPWRATRWAWFWLLPVPGGVLAFLLLSGPTPLVPAPADPGRRLTGGWAFLLGAALTPTWAA